VGGYFTNSAWRAALFSNGTVTDLNSFVDPALGWTLGEAKCINDAGLIVGSGYKNSQWHAFLLTPSPGQPPSPVPAATPLTLAITGMALIGMLWRRKIGKTCNE
jgi:hypothetical protein